MSIAIPILPTKNHGVTIGDAMKFKRQAIAYEKWARRAGKAKTPVDSAFFDAMWSRAFARLSKTSEKIVIKILPEYKKWHKGLGVPLEDLTQADMHKVANLVVSAVKNGNLTEDVNAKVETIKWREATTATELARILLGNHDTEYRIQTWFREVLVSYVQEKIDERSAEIRKSKQPVVHRDFQ